MLPTLRLAIIVLQFRALPVPDTEAETRQAVFEALENVDFVAAYMFSLNKHTSQFSKQEWQEILRKVGQKRLITNVVAAKACYQHGLIQL